MSHTRKPNRRLTIFFRRGIVAPEEAGLMSEKYRWARKGDVGAFFGLMLDNLSDLVVMAAILTGVFGMPGDLVFKKMLPGTAVGVLIGDLVFTWMAFRLAKKTGRDDVTAMPLGLDTLSTFGLTLGVLGPAYLATKDAELTWKIGMAVIVISGVVKVAASFFGEAIRRFVPRAGLLGSISAVALLLIGFLSGLKIFGNPVVGFASFGVILLTLIAGRPLPKNLPGAAVAVLLGTVLYYVLGAFGSPWGGSLAEAGRAWEIVFRPPTPTLGFLGGLSGAAMYLPVVIPLAVALVVGGIDVTESAAAAGDEYDTRQIVLADGIATIVAGLCGGVLQSTPYIGHPAYKKMGGRAAYTLATALFIGLGGMLGYVSFFIQLLPKAAVTPILLFIGIEITQQAFTATPKRHVRAVIIAFIPVIAQLCSTILDISRFDPATASLSPEALKDLQTIRVLAGGFILTALLWGAATAKLIDRLPGEAAVFFVACALLSLFGVIHSPFPGGVLFWPWKVESPVPFAFFWGYLLLAAFPLVMKGFGEGREGWVA